MDIILYYYMFINIKTNYFGNKFVAFIINVFYFYKRFILKIYHTGQPPNNTLY